MTRILLGHLCLRRLALCCMFLSADPSIGVPSGKAFTARARSVPRRRPAPRQRRNRSAPSALLEAGTVLLHRTAPAKQWHKPACQAVLRPVARRMGRPISVLRPHTTRRGGPRQAQGPAVEPGRLPRACPPSTQGRACHGSHLKVPVYFGPSMPISSRSRRGSIGNRSSVTLRASAIALASAFLNASVIANRHSPAMRQTTLSLLPSGGSGTRPLAVPHGQPTRSACQSPPLSAPGR